MGRRIADPALRRWIDRCFLRSESVVPDVRDVVVVPIVVGCGVGELTGGCCCCCIGPPAAPAIPDAGASDAIKAPAAAVGGKVAAVLFMTAAAAAAILPPLLLEGEVVFTVTWISTFTDSRDDVRCTMFG